MFFEPLFQASDGLLVEIGLSAGIVVGALVLAKVFYWFLKKYVEHLTARTRTTLDDRLLAAFEKPLLLLVFSAGFYAALARLAPLAPYMELLERFFSAVWIALGTYLLLRVGNAVLAWYAEDVAAKSRLMVGEIVPTARRVWLLFVVVMGAIIILGTFGIEVSPLLASLGIAGLAVALAFQDTLANFFAGVYITADRPVKTGDYIKLDSGDEGYVTKIGWRSTQIRTLPGNIVVVPNSKLAQSIITNYYAPEKDMSVVIQCSVAYGTDLEKAEKIVVDVAKKVLRSVKGGVKTFEPFVRYHTFGDSGIGFSIILRVEEFTDKFLVTHEFVKALHARFKEEGIEIPFPKRHVYLEEVKHRQ